MNNADSLRSYWMPFTANAKFAAAPRLFSSAEGMFYTTTDGSAGALSDDCTSPRDA